MATRIGVFFDGTGNNMWNDVRIGVKNRNKNRNRGQVFNLHFLGYTNRAIKK